MTDPDVTFLLDAANYFQRRDTGGEDRAHWSNVYNAENCRRIAARLQRDSDRHAERENSRSEVEAEGCQSGPKGIAQ